MPPVVETAHSHGRIGMAVALLWVMVVYMVFPP
jgi:hypothetical protein